MVYLIIIMLLTAADQAIKFLVNNQIAPTDQIPVIDSFFYLVNRQNRGAAWSFLADQNWGIYVLAGVSLVATLVMFSILYRTQMIKLRICLVIIISGSLGNLIDRVRLQYVTDYLELHFGTYIFPIFNLADMLVVCGTVLLCLLLLSEPTLIDGFLSKKTSVAVSELQTGAKLPDFQTGTTTSDRPSAGDLNSEEK